MITVVGLGNERGDLTTKGKEAILNAVQNGDKILVRTARTVSYQSVVDLGIEHTCLDTVYSASRSFSTLAKNLAKAVADAGENAVYLVDGSATEDTSVKALFKRFKGKIKIIDGVSKVTALARLANFNGCSYTSLSAYELMEEKAPLRLPLIVYDIDDRALASDCKLILGDLFGEETTVKYLYGGKAEKIKLYELDRVKAYDYTSAVVIEEIPLLEKNRFTIDDLKQIIVRLRAKDGCPWDRVQTCESIKMAVVEEAYELVDAIDQKDDDKILEEAGDIVLQAVFHAVLKEETGAFNLTDLLSGICHKLITRHTHVFGKDGANDEKSALSVWEKNKMTEKHQVTFADTVNDVPKCFPALMRAQKVGKRAGKSGLDFENVEQAKQSLFLELDEFLMAYTSGDEQETEKELGDVLFSVVNMGRKAGVDCEKALKESVQRFAKRFTVAEKLAQSEVKDVTKLSAKEWDGYYQKAKTFCK